LQIRYSLNIQALSDVTLCRHVNI